VPANDGSPVWSPDGSSIAYAGSDFYSEPNHFVGLTTPAGTTKLASGVAPIAFSPDGSQLAFSTIRVDDALDALSLAVVPAHGPGMRVLVDDARPVAWTEAGIVFSDASGLARIEPDGTGLRRYPPAVKGTPSPDGSRFAYADRSQVWVVAADGTGTTSVGLGQDPLWSRDGSSLAFARGSTIVVSNIVRSRRFETGSAVPVSWSPDGRQLLYTAAGAVFVLDLRTGRHALLTVGTDAAYSPDGGEIAYAAVGPCVQGNEGRQGIYVMQADGTGRRRLTNDCHVVGTSGADQLVGTQYYDIIEGLGGNDTLQAVDGYYTGDTLLGGPGDDTLIGDVWGDKLNGGPGNDTISGGNGWDVITGGPGHDHIDAGRGADVIHAVDGERDWINCGRPGDGKNRPDVVYADRIDVVASDCKVVHRSPW
jgi:hypothetical protein